MSHTIGKILGTAAVATGLAVLPSAASAAQGPISGASYRGCTTVTGTYGWELTSAGLDMYRTWGSARLVNHPSKCPTGFTAGVLQRSTTHTTDHSWNFYAAVDPGGTFTRDLSDTNVRGVRFRICNVHSGGVIDGCGRVQ
ncbi:hypothetical protein OKJ48_00230 [Streptomyces kunmingensis]|uniref:Secreted protein n=1 Tax=Streptomyces kunmingensis TaxID=68225 RepID=A0ABU6C255_9ACTN|nr:hypothetical protein [Streptomyces kunmingensis]MEB3958692.1 hypothetical protein [Streptomyces kunmingensis]